MKKQVLLSLGLACLLVMGLACEEKNVDEALEEAEADEGEGEEDQADEGGEEGAALEDGEKADEEADEGREADKEASASVGKAAPGFELEDQDGETHQLSDYEGKTVVLEWFNPECPFVQRHHDEEKTMGATYDELTEEDEDLVWLAIDSTKTVEADKSAEIKEEWEIDYPILQDPSGQVGRLYEAKTTPHMYIIDAEGTLQYAGAIDDDEGGKEKVEDRTNYVTEAFAALEEDEKIEDRQTKPYGCSVKYAKK